MIALPVPIASQPAGTISTPQTRSLRNFIVAATLLFSYSYAHFTQTGAAKTPVCPFLFMSLRTLAKTMGVWHVRSSVQQVPRRPRTILRSFVTLKNATHLFSAASALLQCTPGVYLFSVTSNCSTMMAGRFSPRSHESHPL